MKRWLKTLLVLVAIFLLPTLWLLVFHIVAKHALERYKAQLRAAGEKLTIDEILPPPVPPEKNGAKLFLQGTPYIHDGSFTKDHLGVLNSNPPGAMRTIPPGKAIIGWQQPQIISVWEDRIITNTWEDVAQEFKQQAPDLELLHQALSFSQLDFGFDYHDNAKSFPLFLPVLAKLKGAALLLSYATVFDLNRGETSSAATNVHALLILVNKADEHLLISQLVRNAIAAIASGAQWEVLQSTNLTDAQLAMLQHDWESLDVLQPMENAFEVERFLSLATTDQLRTSNSPSASMSIPSASSGSNSSGPLDFIGNWGKEASRASADTLWRISWSYEDQLRTLQDQQVAIETVRQIETNGLFENALAEQDRKIKALGLDSRTNDWLRMHLAKGILDAFDTAPGTTVKVLNRLLRAEAMRKIAISAVALKRYELRHGSLPASLGALAPEFLSEIPRDPMDGKPLTYQPNPDGTFTLYSVNWVWPQPATAEEIQQYYTNLQQRTSVYK